MRLYTATNPARPAAARNSKIGNPGAWRHTIYIIYNQHNEPTNDMKQSLRRLLPHAALALLLLAMLASCAQMHEDTDDCPTGLYLDFKYDYNLQRADMFSDHVGAVTVYIFDDEGRYVGKREEANEGDWRPLASPTWRMHITDLPDGRYQFLVLAGQKSYESQLLSPGAKFVRTEPAVGDSMKALSVDLQTTPAARAVDDAALTVDHQGQPLDTLWHGRLTEPVEVRSTRPTYATVSLVRDMKQINVFLRELDDPTTMDVANYEWRIYDRNTHIRWDNSLDERDAVVYTPYVTWNSDDRTPAFDGSGNPVEGVGKIAHANFMTSRLLYHDQAADDAILSVVNRQTGVEVVRVNLPDLLSRLVNAQDLYRYSQQEVLDRGYDFQLEFFLKNDRLAYVNIGISVLGWSTRVQFEDL